MSIAHAPTEILRQHFSRCTRERFTVRPVNAAEVNSRNWLVHLNNEAAPRFILKKKISHDAGLPKQWQSYLREYVLATQKTDLLPKLLPADNGELFVPDGDTLFRLFEYRVGGDFPKTSAALRDAGSALAQVHLAIRSSSFAETSNLYKNLSTTEAAAALKSVKNNWAEVEFGQIAFQWLTQQAPELYTEMEFVESQTQLPRQPVHHDFVPHNSLFEGDRVAAVLDPDSLVVDFPMQAVAFAASRFSPERPPWDFLAGYHSVIPLTAIEVRLFPAFVRREAVRRINWILRTNLLQGRDCWRSDMSKHLRNIERTHVWDSEFALADGLLSKKLNGQ
jgi:Ser/Thr protein kinase RdoA (MazF antagonist)